MNRIFITLICLTSLLIGQTKRNFDLDSPGLRKGNDGVMSVGYNYETLSNNYLEATIVNGGYFTLGTVSGISQSIMDDNSSLTFGHPYAMTSYPIIKIEGEWLKLEDYFNESEIIRSTVGDTLRLQAEKIGEIKCLFEIILSDSGFSINEEVEYAGTSKLEIALGLVYDPAIGKWGDCAVEYENGIIEKQKSLSAPSSLMLWERNGDKKGICSLLDFGNEAPEEVLIGNWNNFYKADSEILQIDETEKLYDVLLKAYYPTDSLAAGEKMSFNAKLKLLTPEFPEAIIRWDMPTSLTLEGTNILFPDEFNSYVTLLGEENYSFDNAKLLIETTSALSTDSSDVELKGKNFLSQRIPMKSRILYENKIVDVNAVLYKNGKAVDKLTKYVFIPETPVSDEGLEVTIDTMNIDGNQVDLVFHAKDEEKGYIISDLKEDNVFLYENNSRISEFSFARDTSGGVYAADIIFVLDVTGSMGNEIGQVKDNIVEFADNLSGKGIDYRLGMVTFLDVIENKYPFTKDVQEFRDIIGQQYAHGGGDGPENSLDALYEAAQYKFRDDAAKVFVWITDINYHENDWATSRTKSEVVTELLKKGIKVYAIGPSYHQTDAYDPIILPTGGSFFDIGGNFKDILFEIADFKTSGKFVVSYTSDDISNLSDITLEIRYAGMGGKDTTQVKKGKLNTNSAKHLAFYPNPFNPVINLNVNLNNYVKGKIKIYNILGQMVKSYNLNKGMSNVTWNARNNDGVLVGSGFYIVQLTLTDQTNQVHKETAKILYLK